MYVRFIVLAPKPRRPFGLFRAAKPMLKDPELPHWLRDPIEAHFRWFNAHLPRPYTGLPKRRRLPVTTLCWLGRRPRPTLRGPATLLG
jgi:hypothetical protein